jgi:septum formation protein
LFKNNYKLVLASSSERRLLLLKRIGYVPDIVDAPEIDENIYINEKPDLYVKRIAREKAEKVSKKHKNSYIIAADTVIFSGAKIYGKAFNESDAFTILKKLSGRRHRVYGAICVISPNKNISLKVIITQVSFRVISDKEIEDYISEGEWEGKAGCYAIQGIASKFIKKINGNYDNVVGLSLIDIDKMLKGIKP